MSYGALLWLGVVRMIRSAYLKGLKPVLEGFVVTMQEGACDQEDKSWGRQVKGFDALFTQAPVHCGNQSLQIFFNHDYDMAFSISPCAC